MLRVVKIGPDKYVALTPTGEYGPLPAAVLIDTLRAAAYTTTDITAALHESDASWTNQRRSGEFSNRRYRSFDATHGYPAGPNLFYECLRCGGVVASAPSDNTHCACRNIMIDADYGRLNIHDHRLAKLFEAAD